MRILLVDDSMLVRSMIKSFIGQWAGYEIAGEGSNGEAGVLLAMKLRPDLIIMDVNMPVMNGIEATRRIMESCPVPILVFTSEDVSKIGYEAINAGALEILPKPDIAKMNDPLFVGEFRSVLDSLTRYGRLRRDSPSPGRRTLKTGHQRKTGDFDILVVGASTGGPSAVRRLLSDLPGDFPLPVVLSQHIEAGFDQGYADWLNDGIELQVKLAPESRTLHAGEVLVARATHHLVFSGGSALLDDGPPLGNQKPSVDKMFLSARSAYGARVLAVLLTGMGSDGAKGCRAIVDAGGYTLVQDKESSIIFGMPKAAIELGGATEILALEEIGPFLRRMAEV